MAISVEQWEFRMVELQGGPEGTSNHAGVREMHSERFPFDERGVQGVIADAEDKAEAYRDSALWDVARTWWDPKRHRFEAHLVVRTDEESNLYHGDDNLVHTESVWQGTFNANDEGILDVSRVRSFHRYLVVLERATLPDGREVFPVWKQVEGSGFSEYRKAWAWFNQVGAWSWSTHSGPDKSSMVVQSLVSQASQEQHLNLTWVDLHEGAVQEVKELVVEAHRNEPACVDPANSDAQFPNHDWVEPLDFDEDVSAHAFCTNCGMLRNLIYLGAAGPDVWSESKRADGARVITYAEPNPASLIILGRLRERSLMGGDGDEAVEQNVAPEGSENSYQGMM